MSGISEVVNPNNSLLKSAQAFSGVSLPSLKKCKEACRKPFAWLRENLKKLGKTHLAETGYVGMDTLGAVRKTDAVYNTIIANNPSSVATPGVLLGTGIVEVGTGASQIGRGLSALEEVKENGDLTAGTVASLRIVRGANEATSGATMAASNGLTLARTGNSQVEKALTSLGSAANITSGISNSLIAIYSSISLAECLNVSRKLSKALKENEKEGQIKALKDMLVPTKEEKEQILDHLVKGEHWYTRLIQGVARLLSGQDTTEQAGRKKRREALEKVLSKAFKEEDYKSLEEIPGIEKFKDEITDDEVLNQFIKENKEIPDHPLVKALIRAVYADELGRLNARKEAVFKRTAGDTALGLLKPKLTNEISAIDEKDKTAIIEAAQKDLKRNEAINLAVITLATIGAVITFMAQFATGGTLDIIELAIGLFTSTAWLFVDGYFLYQAFKNDPSTSKQKVLKALAVLTLFGSTIAGIALDQAAKKVAPLLTIASLGAALMLYLVYLWKTHEDKTALPATT